MVLVCLKEPLWIVVFFAALTHDRLAEHIFPDSFQAADRNTIIAHFIREIYRLFGFRVTHNNTAYKWYPRTIPGGDLSLARPVSKYFPKQPFCDLYCADCRECCDSQVTFDVQPDKKYHGEVHVVARLQMSVVETNEGEPELHEGSVCSLFHHFVHNHACEFKQRMAAGWCVLDVPPFVSDTYDAAVQHCREAIYPGRGRRIARSEDLQEIDRAPGQGVDNRYYLMMSSATDEWDVRAVNSCCNEEELETTLVQLSRHQRVVVTLFFMICSRLGLQEIASPFVHEVVNHFLQIDDPPPNPNFRSFCCEESLLVGAFSRAASAQAQKWHVDHAGANAFKDNLLTVIHLQLFIFLSC
jgi:hypothetical protein